MFTRNLAFRNLFLRSIVGFSFAVVACFAPAAQTPPDEHAAKPEAAREPGVPDALRKPLLDGEWDRALEVLATIEKQRPELADWWTYLRGTTLARAKRYDAALEAFDAVEKREPPSEWRHKARFARAEVLRDTRRTKEAEAIYEDEAKRLLSEKRQDELASIYNTLADPLSTPPAANSPEASRFDPERAFGLYERVLALDVTEAAQERALYRMLVCRELQKRWPDELAVVERYRAAFDPARKGSKSIGEHLFEVLARESSARAANNDVLGARRSDEDLIAAIAAARDGREPWTAWRKAAGESKLAELAAIEGDARYAIAATYASGDEAQATLAIAALERFIAAHPDHPKNARAALDIVIRQRELGRSEAALAGFDAFLARPDPANGDAAGREELAKLRMSALYGKGELLAELERYEDAIKTFGEYVARFATGPDWARAQRAIVDAEYSIGVRARHAQQFARAREAWSEFLARNPLDTRAPTIQVDLGELYLAEFDALRASANAEHREPARAQLESLARSAIDEWKRALAKYPKTDIASRALLRTAQVQESALGELEAAVASYRECNFGASAGEAAKSLGRMTEPSLVLDTERVWRTSSAPKIKLALRNVEKLDIELYRLDLEAYFRKNLSHLAIEGLDLDLIAADQKLERDVDGYAKYKPLEREIELPVSGPGVWAVAVTAGSLRVTSLVISSDLDVIVRSSSNEALVFAEDLKNGKPASGVRVLLAGVRKDATPSVIELSTGADGTVGKRLEDLDPNGDLRVLAIRDGHVATNAFAKRIATVASAIAPRGLVYTDRSVYRPGESVNWRAIVREVSDGHYAFQPDSKFTVEIFDAFGQGLAKSELALSKFGSLNGTFTLDRFAPIGDYRVQCTAPSGAVHVGNFTVAEYRLPKVELTLEAAREIYFRGEPVEIVARAAYYWGEPVANSPLAVDLPDGRRLELRTAGDGTAKFSFDTREFALAQVLGVHATLTEEQVASSHNYFLAEREFSATLSTEEQTYLVGTSFDVAVEARTADGKPTSRKLLLTLARRGSIPNAAEEKLEEHELTTDADGRAHQSLALEKGGWYAIHLHGTDRFNNPVDSTQLVFASGEDDPQKLRFVVATHQLKVGEQADFQLVNRAASGLALITIESDRILEHRIVNLSQGVNHVALAVDHVHFPNFTVSAAAMRGEELIADATQFQVSRALTIRVAPERALYRPGETVAVDLTAVDQLGRPVEAELSLAVVDEALFELYPDATAPIRPFFEVATHRDGSFRTSSSCTFSYHGVTRVIASAVLAEAERLRLQAEWDEKRTDGLAKLESLGYLGAQAAQGATAELRAGAESGADKEADATGGVAVFKSARRAGVAGGGGRSRNGPASPAASAPTPALASGSADSQEPTPPDFSKATAFWTASIVTGRDGHAKTSFTLPNSSTRWRLTSRGADATALFGDATATLVTKDEFFVELRAPSTLSEGDRPRCLARVHNLTGLTGVAKLALRAKFGAETKTYPLDVTLGADSDVECIFPELEALPGAGELTLALDAEAELSGTAREGTVAATINARPYRPKARDAAQVDVRAWGLEFVEAKSGVLRGSASFVLELDPARKYSARSLELVLGPSVEALLVSAALDDDLVALRGPESSIAGKASELLGACAVLDLVAKSGQSERPEYLRLRDRARGLIAQLVGTQSPEGSWGWIAHTPEAHTESSCLAMIALASARAHGFAVVDSTIANGLAYLQRAFRDASLQADEIKALLSWALAAHHQGDFGALNRLHRERASLSPAALAYAALALSEMDRGPMAAEIAEVLEGKVELGETIDRRPTCKFSVGGNAAWNRSPLEMTALAALVLERAKPKSEKLAAAIEYLLAHRPWFEARARGLAVSAAANFEGSTAPTSDRVRVVAKLAGGEARTFELAGDQPSARVKLDLDTASAAKVAVELELSGRGTPHFSAVLRGFSSDFAPQSSPLSIDHHDYLADTPRYRGAAMPTGFGVLQDARDAWENRVSELGFGAMTRCRVSFHDAVAYERLRDEGDYLVVEIPLPAGAHVLERSWEGAFAKHVVQRGGSLFVDVGQVSWGGELGYTLIGAVPGRYRALPVVVRSAYDPERMAIGKAVELSVLARGETSHDAYQPTPDELFATGQAMYLAGEHEKSRETLQRLIDGFEPRMREKPLSEAAKVLLFANIERHAPRDIVRYFEVLKEKDPDFYVPFEQVTAVGAAYRTIDEHERALTIFRATIEETFGKELRVVGALEEQKEFDGALTALLRLCREYPDAAAVVSADLSYADRLLKLAPRAHAEASLKAKSCTRASLTFDAILELQRFLALYSREPEAPEAGLDLVTAHLTLEDYQVASKLGGELAAAYAEPRFTDAFGYSRAVAEWYLGHDDRALELLAHIAEVEYPTADGKKIPSPNRDLALYILGQIHHARQEFGDAAKYYERVQALFADARETLASLREKKIALAEITQVKPGEKVELEIAHRNVKEAELLVYPVDLMTLYLREKNLSKITQVNLSGIAPAIRKTVAFQGAEGVQPIKTKVELALADPGAYLVICRGDELHASGLVLVTKLAIDVKEDASGGHVRVQVFDGTTQRYVRDVDVRVIGSLNAEFSAGRTDPRGLFAADGISGSTTVIAKSGAREYAFYRGTAAIAVNGQSTTRAPGRADAQEQYLQNVLDLNGAEQGARDKSLNEEIRRERKGVQIRQVK